MITREVDTSAFATHPEDTEFLNKNSVLKYRVIPIGDINSIHDVIEVYTWICGEDLTQGVGNAANEWLSDLSRIYASGASHHNQETWSSTWVSKVIEWGIAKSYKYFEWLWLSASPKVRHWHDMKILFVLRQNLFVLDAETKPNPSIRDDFAIKYEVLLHTSEIYRFLTKWYVKRETVDEGNRIHLPHIAADPSNDKSLTISKGVPVLLLSCWTSMKNTNVDGGSAEDVAKMTRHLLEDRGEEEGKVHIGQVYEHRSTSYSHVSPESSNAIASWRLDI